MATVVLLVILRLSLGCHFFYEGVWKIKNADKFSAEPFLTQAKGPVAPMFYAMVPDIDGWERVGIVNMATADPVIANLRNAHARYHESFAKALEKAKKPPKERADRLQAFDVAVLGAVWDAEDKIDDYLADCNEVLDEMLQAGETVSADTLKTWGTEIGRIEKESHAELVKAIKEKGRIDAKISRKVLDKDPQKAIGIKPGITGKSYLADWSDLRNKITQRYELTEAEELELEKQYRRYKDALKKYFAENLEKIDAYFGSLERFNERKAAGTNGAEHEQKRIWDEQQKLRREVGAWIKDIEQMDADFRSAIWRILEAGYEDPAPLPEKFTFSKFVNFAVTWGLTAIGFCLLLGAFTRPAALGGAAFLTFVLLTQPPWPTIYPPAPAVVGHAMVIDKNFIELIALLVIASCAAGRWAGVDYFIENYVMKWCPCCKCLCKSDTGETKSEETPADSAKTEATSDDKDDAKDPETKKEGT